MYDSLEEDGLNSDLSIKEGLSTLGKWTARTPADFAAEYYRFGKVAVNMETPEKRSR